MSQGGYTQTILLDANRLSSEEYSASNLSDTDDAIFTNKVSNGITIDIGDQVSIESAHIAQRGAGGSVIQMDGEVLGEKDITTTETINASFIGFNLGIGEGYSPSGYAYETSSNESQKVKMKDNEASVVISYYKTTNGENNICLPRNWGSASMGKSAHGGDPHGGGLKNASFWVNKDSYAKGLNTYPFTASHIFTPDFVESDALNCCGGQVAVRKLKQDNSKYTIFKRSEIIWRHSEVSSASSASYLQPVPTKPDPALGDYNRLLQKVVLNVPAGYNSPSSISSDLTDKLIKTDAPQSIISATATSVLNSTLYKALPCANYSYYSVSGCQDFFGNASLADHLPINVGDTSVNSIASVEYLSSYSHIGFKRPDFVESGRDITTYHGNKLTETIQDTQSATAIISTNFSYNDETLIKLKRFFDSQRMYPELLDHATDATNDLTNYASLYPDATSASLNASFRKEARFLHLGLSGSGHLATATDALGSDMYNVSFSASNLPDTPRTNASDSSSIPIFIYFNENCSHLTTEDTNGDTNANLAFGFARNNNGNVDLITEPIGGIPDPFFREQAGDNINADTKIGYDYHFSAYGNSAIMLSNGFNPLQYYGQINYELGELIRQVYLGANNALFNFDTTESRFEISNLHAAEKVGNFYTAGDPNPTADVFAPPPSAQAGQDCFKINKQLKYDSWSPCMHPYSEITLSGTFSDNTQKTFIPANINLTPGLIYDSHGGVSIEDMGIDETSWEQSIWGLLGFEYGQFNASGDIETIKNINNRFTNDTINTSGITTNADVISVDSQQFQRNPYSTNMFNSMLPTAVRFFDHIQNLTANVVGITASHVVDPAIVINADSTKIIANQLPRKILRGYFLINSDILDSANYYQLANPLQTMAIVGKYNGANDFISYDGGGAVFTATRKKTITSIKTEILDPEGGTANVGDNSGVIYRIDKVINTDLKFAETLMQQMSQK
tara:strand:- start:35 stop:2926 length:2892 start_codon:yes stop_codon:yes gene_type:complete